MPPPQGPNKKKYIIRSHKQNEEKAMHTMMSVRDAVVTPHCQQATHMSLHLLKCKR